MSEPVRYEVDGRRRDDHPEPPRGDERPRRRHQGGAARRRTPRPRRTPPCAASCSPAAAAPSASGQDLKEHIAILESSDAESLFRTVEEHYNPIVTALATMPKPVVAAVNGVAAGAGASLAFACDFRVLAEAAGFNLAFAGVALSCDTGSSWTLPRLVGRAKAHRAALLPAHDRLRRVARARAGHHAWSPPDEFEAEVADARPPARRRADRVLRRDPALGGVLRRPRLRGVAGVRGVDDDADRRHRGPPQRRRAFVNKEKPAFTGR